jgi:hypothetical protein
MHVNAHRRIGSIILLLASMFFCTSVAWATVPPDYVELTRAEMQGRQFTFKIHMYDAWSTIELQFPKRSRGREFWLVPYSTYIVVKAKAGEVIASTPNHVENNEVLSIGASYNHLISDVSVSITYGCARADTNECYGATTFAIPSVSKFIDANPDALNLPIHCQKVPGSAIEILDCTK